MAFQDPDGGPPFWLPLSLPEDVFEGSVRLILDESPPEAPPGPTGFIIHNWFGPFLLASPTRFLRGRC